MRWWQWNGDFDCNHISMYRLLGNVSSFFVKYLTRIKRAYICFICSHFSLPYERKENATNKKWSADFFQSAVKLSRSIYTWYEQIWINMKISTPLQNWIFAWVYGFFGYSFGASPESRRFVSCSCHYEQLRNIQFLKTYAMFWIIIQI